MNRVESLVSQMVTTLTGLATTGANVFRTYEQVDALPAIVIKQGSNVVDTKEFGDIVRGLSVVVEIRIKKSTTAETELNAINAEVYEALIADTTQGFAWVDSTELVNDSEPTQKDLEQSIVSQTTEYKVKYRHSTKTLEG